MMIPDVDCASVLSDEQSFDVVDTLFDDIADGKQRIELSDFVSHFRKQANGPTASSDEMQMMYGLIDADGNGSVSKLELVAALMRSPRVSRFLLPSTDARHILSDEEAFDAANAVFDSIAGGKQRIYPTDFDAYFRQLDSARLKSPFQADRGRTRVLIIGPGFGQQLNPRQGSLLQQAGFQVHWCSAGIPNPEQPGFRLQAHLDQIKTEMHRFQPHVVAAASKGGVYVAGLWQSGYWRGPTLLINAHPACRELPRDAVVVLAHGSNDEVYPTSRADLERLVSACPAERRFLYYTANSGRLRSGQFTRTGDGHNMESLLTHDCLPRLLDASVCPDGPEAHMVRTWRDRLGIERRRAEAWLGYTPEHLRMRWVSLGAGDCKLFEVSNRSEEFRQIATIFHAAPAEAPAYLLSPQATWDQTRISRVQRVENDLQYDGSARPYFDSLRRSLQDQGLELEPGSHTCWAFHGADDLAIESIVSNPVAAFQPLASGTRNATLWGSGTYFARDPKYVADGGFCGPAAPDGTRKMLMCLLMTGVPCVGDPEHRGVLPFRQRPHRYHCSVDSLSSPEIYILQHPGAAIPSYLISFA